MSKGIRSITGVRAKCSHRGECWLWKGNVDNRGLPRGHFATPDGIKQLRVRRWVFEQHNGHAAPQLVGSTCGNTSCCNPAHLFSETYSERSTRSSNAVVMPELKAKRIAAGRAANGLLKLTQEQARAIRQDSRPAWKIAPEYGVSRATVWDIKAGKTWAEPKVTANASVFALGASLGGLAA